MYIFLAPKQYGKLLDYPAISAMASGPNLIAAMAEESGLRGRRLMCTLKRRLRRLAISSVVLLCMSLGAVRTTSAQSDRGTIQGLVTDQSGAVLPNAKVEILHSATGTVTTVSSNSEGRYTAPNL